MKLPLHLLLVIFVTVMMVPGAAIAQVDQERDSNPSGAAIKSESEQMPNIVILYADDMGYGDLAIQNPDSKIPTPNLDQLARDGIRFTDGHSSSGICTPSRYALLTGRYHWRKFHGIVDAFGPSVFDAERFTLPEMLREKGYATACIGKWHLGWDWEAIRNKEVEKVAVEGRPNRNAFPPDAFDWSSAIPDGPLAHGFDYYFGDDVPNFPPYAFIENDRVVTAPNAPLTANPPTAEGNWEARPGPMVAGWQLDAVVPRNAEKAVEWIGRQSADKPFFLYFPLTSPHAPIVPAESFRGKSEAGGYGDFVFETDWACGEVLKALEAGGFADNTLVIFTADNGPEHYAYERVRKFEHRSAGPLRGLKRDIFEGGHRVPFIIRWPGIAPAGTINGNLIGQIDLMATIATIVDFEMDETTAEDSIDMLPLLHGGNEPLRTSVVHNTYENRWAIRSDPLVLIDSESGNHTRVPDWFAEAEGFEPNPLDHALYDLSSDPGQRNNLAAEQPEKVAELRELLNSIRGN